MVKGISRRVVLIKSPDPKIFDEAIFLVREETAKKPGVTYEQILHEAANVAPGAFPSPGGSGPA